MSSTCARCQRVSAALTLSMSMRFAAKASSTWLARSAVAASFG
jgi:hypothetical protein